MNENDCKTELTYMLSDLEIGCIEEVKTSWQTQHQEQQQRQREIASPVCTKPLVDYSSSSEESESEIQNKEGMVQSHQWGGGSSKKSQNGSKTEQKTSAKK